MLVSTYILDVIISGLLVENRPCVLLLGSLRYRMANQSAFTSAIGHNNAADIARMHVRAANTHVETMGTRRMLNDGTSYLPVSKRQRLALHDKINSSETSVEHPTIVRYPLEGE